MAQFVKHYRITDAEYKQRESLEKINKDAIYFIIDTGNIIMNGKKYGGEGGSSGGIYWKGSEDNLKE